MGTVIPAFIAAFVAATIGLIFSDWALIGVSLVAMGAVVWQECKR